MVFNKKAQIQGIGVLILIVLVIYIINSNKPTNTTITIHNGLLSESKINVRTNYELIIVNNDAVTYQINIGESQIFVNSNSATKVKLNVGNYRIYSQNYPTIEGEAIVR